MGRSANAFRQFWISRLNALSECNGSFNEYLRMGDYLFDSPITKSNDFRLSVSEYGQLINVIASDIDRFAIASIDTVLSIKQINERPKATGWALIEAYYAAFFASNALSRLLGVFVTYVAKPEAIRLQRVAIAQGVLGKCTISAGNYSFKYDKAGSTIGSKLSKARSGAHGLFWREFSSLLERCSTAIIASAESTADDQDVALFVDKLREALDLLENASWLTETRNSINYRQHFGVWYPYHVDAQIAASLFIARNVFIEDPLPSYEIPHDAQDIVGFVSTCAALVAFSFDVLNDLGARHPDGKSFLRFGTLKSLRLCGC
jgi:hypothetical protein